MIQFRRGTTKNLRNTRTKLASGQPGYDKDKHKIKIGDGRQLWQELPYASGLFSEEILNSEEKAKNRIKLDPEDTTIFTYGTELPTKDTVGQVYLQYDIEPEVDYVVKSGINGIWTYQQWKSGIARCWGILKTTGEVSKPVALEGIGESEGAKLFCEFIPSTNYPFIFKELPVETASLQNSGGTYWLANAYKNTVSTSGRYTIFSPWQEWSSSDFFISLQVDGIWR